MNLSIRQGALACNRPSVPFDAHDRRSQSASGVTRIKDERKPVAELLDQLLDVCTGGASGKVGARAGNRSTDRFDQRTDDARIGPTQSYTAGVSRDLERKTVCRLHYKSQSAGPKSVRQSQEGIGHIACEHQCLFDGIDKDGQRPRLRARFQLKNALHRVQVERIGTEAVERVGRCSNDATTLDKARRVTDEMPLGGFRRDS